MEELASKYVETHDMEIIEELYQWPASLADGDEVIGIKTQALAPCSSPGFYAVKVAFLD